MLTLTDDRHRNIVFWGMALIAVGLPLSVFSISVGMFVLAANWLLEGSYRQRLSVFIRDPLALMCISIYLMMVLGMAYTHDLAHGLKELRIKLPILLMPLLLFTSKLPHRRRLKDILLLFVVATVIGTLLGFKEYLQLSTHGMMNRRELSVFISHIRFGLMVVFSFFVMAYYLVEKRKCWSITEKLLSLATMGWLFYFLILLESPSAYLAFAALLSFSLVRAIMAARSPAVRYAAIVLVVLGAVSSAAYVANICRNHFLDIPFDYRTLDIRTANGRMYAHEKDVLYRENGHRVWNFVCWDELRNEWPARSGLSIDGPDGGGQGLKYTLIRYLSSKGLRKDSIGVHALSDADISNIEKGYTNCRYVDAWGVSRRIDQLLLEIQEYEWKGDPNTSSLVQRIIYFKVGLQLIKQHWAVGVGTGDVRGSFDAYYNGHDLGLDENRKGISHNQFMSIAIAYGLLGLMWFILAFAYPLRYYWKDYLYAGFILMMAVSFLSDNTLDSQPGATLFAFLNVLLMLRRETQEGLNKD